MVSNLTEGNESRCIDIISFNLRVYKHKLSQMTKDNLTQEIQRFKSRYIANIDAKCSLDKSRFKVSGNRQEVEQRLVAEARFWIERSLEKYPSRLESFSRDLSTQNLASVAKLPQTSSPSESHINDPEVLASDKFVHGESDEEDVIYLSDSSADEEGGNHERKLLPNSTVDKSKAVVPTLSELPYESDVDCKIRGEYSLAVEDSEVSAAAVAADSSENNVEKIVKWFFGFAKLKAAQRCYYLYLLYALCISVVH
jgi:hypothetical protein